MRQINVVLAMTLWGQGAVAILHVACGQLVPGGLGRACNGCAEVGGRISSVAGFLGWSGRRAAVVHGR